VYQTLISCGIKVYCTYSFIKDQIIVVQPKIHLNCYTLRVIIVTLYNLYKNEWANSRYFIVYNLLFILLFIIN